MEVSINDKYKYIAQKLKIFNENYSERVFRVDRDCYIIYTGSSPIDKKPFIRIGYSRYLEKIKKHISNVIIAAGYLSTLSKEIEEIESETHDTNFIVPESIYNVIKKLVKERYTHKININIIDKGYHEVNYSEVLKEISQKYKTFVLLYNDGNFGITFSGKKIFDMFSSTSRDMTTQKFLEMISAKMQKVLPENSIANIGNTYILETKDSETLISTSNSNPQRIVESLIPLKNVKTVIGNNVVSLIDTIRLVNDKKKLKVYTTKEIFDDFKKFSLGIKIVEVSENIEVIKNLNIKSQNSKYIIPLIDKNGHNNGNLVIGEEGKRKKEILQLEEGEYMIIGDFKKNEIPKLLNEVFLHDPEEIKDQISEIFENTKKRIAETLNIKVNLTEIEQEVYNDTQRIIKDRKRLEELLSTIEEIEEMNYKEKALVMSFMEKLDSEEKKKQIEEAIKQIEEETKKTTTPIPSLSKQKIESSQKEHPVKGKRKTVFERFSQIPLWIAVLLAVFLISIIGISSFYVYKNIIFLSDLNMNRKIQEIVDKLEDTYEPELTQIQNTLGITITDYDIWVYVNKVAILNGYKPLYIRKVSRSQDPNWVYPGKRLKMPDDTMVIVRKNDNMWNISKRKIIENYIKKHYKVILKSRVGTTEYAPK